MTTYPSNLTQLTDRKTQALARAANNATRRLALKSRPPLPGTSGRPADIVRRWATVTNVVGTGLVNLQLDGKTLQDDLGGTGEALAVSCLASYSPTIGDTVIVDHLGGDMVVLGNTASGADDVPVGAIVAYRTLPATAVALSNTTGTAVGSCTFPVVDGHTYLFTFDGIIDVGSVNPLYINMSVTLSPYTGPSGVNGFIIGAHSPQPTAAVPGVLDMPISPTGTGTETCSFAAACTGTSATGSVPVNSVLAVLVRTG